VLKFYFCNKFQSLLNFNKNNILIIKNPQFFVKYFFTFLLLFFYESGLSQQDTVLQSDTLTDIGLVDSSAVSGVSGVLPSDSIKNKDVISPDAVDELIDYSCSDSILFSFTDEKMFLYGSGDLSAKDMDLKSSYVEISTKDSYLFAKTVSDSSSSNKIKPVLTQGKESFTVSSIKYNFRTKKALVKDVKTQTDQGYLHSDIAKMQTDKELHIKDGKFTTCDLDHPHFYIELTKAKKIPDKHIISGPMYFVIADIPLYFIGLPFGILPNQKKNSSGVIIPEYGEDQQRGFFLRNGGYFFAVNDYLNASFLGDIYSRGSWGLTGKMNFKKRYRYSGSLELKYSKIQTGEKVLLDSRTTSSFSVLGNYAQDSKANPNGTFSVSLNFGKNFVLDAKTLNDLTDNTKSSSISYRWSRPGSIFNFSANLRGTQNSKTHAVNLLLPDLALNMKRQTPFKSSGAGGADWYRKIGFSLSIKARNSLTTTDTTLFDNDVWYQMKNGLQYSLPVSTSFSLFNYINVSPSLNFNGRLYTSYVRQRNVLLAEGDEIVSEIKNDTVYKVTMPFDFQVSVPFSTKFYGIFNINKGRVKAVRHVVSPSLSFSYRPDFSRDFWGYYGYNEETESYYSYYTGYIFGGPPSGKSGAVSLSVGNNLEMKVKAKNDTVDEFKKIKLIDNLNFGVSYNLAADSLNFSNIYMRGNTRLLKNFSLSFSADFDPYVKDTLGHKINVFEWTENSKIARFNSGRLGLTGSLKPEKKKNGKGQKSSSSSEFYYYPYPEIPYADFDIPWNLSVNYNFNVINKFDIPTRSYIRDVTQTVSMNASLSLTSNWQITGKANYDFAAKKFSYAQFTVYRDLHCWEMTFNVIPFGTLKSYSFRINIKSSIFKGIEYNKRKEWDKSVFY